MFVLDDHDVVVRGLVDLIDAEPDMVVVGTAATEREAIRRIDRLQPDVAVLDVRLAEGCGLNVCRHVSKRHPGVASVMLTSIDDQRVLVEAAVAGAVGFCHKSLSAADIIDTVRAVAGGARLLDPS
ncbi:MAG: response regulator transcription factor, partial [Acidimicrobiales bacterium]